MRRWLSTCKASIARRIRASSSGAVFISVVASLVGGLGGLQCYLKTWAVRSRRRKCGSKSMVLSKSRENLDVHCPLMAFFACLRVSVTIVQITDYMFEHRRRIASVGYNNVLMHHIFISKLLFLSDLCELKNEQAERFQCNYFTRSNICC